MVIGLLVLAVVVWAGVWWATYGKGNPHQAEWDAQRTEHEAKLREIRERYGVSGPR